MVQIYRASLVQRSPYSYRTHIDTEQSLDFNKDRHVESYYYCTILWRFAYCKVIQKESSDMIENIEN
jgi:hypothetical protein